MNMERKRRNKYDSLLTNYNNEEIAYFHTLLPKTKENLMAIEKDLYNLMTNITPMRFRLLLSNTSNEKYIDYNSNVYLSKEESAHIIKTDSDNYIRNLSKYDLYARDVSTSEEYIYKIIEGCLNFSEKQVIKLNNCSKIARNFFDNKLPSIIFADMVSTQDQKINADYRFGCILMPAKRQAWVYLSWTSSRYIRAL